MPLPEPFNNEPKEQFMARCMQDDAAVEEFPRGDQRQAVCLVQWEQSDKAPDTTDFPTAGDNLQVSLRNSQYSQFDWDFASNVKENSPETWKKGGNIRGNEAFNFWTTAKDKTADALTEGESDWIREREAWAARHFKNNRLAGVVALMKWGVIGEIGESNMKEIIRESMEKESEEKGVSSSKSLSEKIMAAMRATATFKRVSKSGTVKEKEYLDYIVEHKLNVGKAFEFWLGVMPSGIEAVTEDEIVMHDMSKLSDAEFDAYRMRFFPEEGEDKSEADAAFAEAWEHHWGANHHHYNAFTDSQMPLGDVEHMVVDWTAMSLKFGDNPYKFYASKRRDMREFNVPFGVLEYKLGLTPDRQSELSDEDLEKVGKEYESVNMGDFKLKTTGEESEEKMQEKMKKQRSFSVRQIGPESDRTLRFTGSDETRDRDNDIIRALGWKLDDYRKNPVFLYMHDMKILPIGKAVDVQIDMGSKALMFDIKFPTIAELSTDANMAHDHAKFADMIYNMYKNGYLNDVSVGFRAIEYDRINDGQGGFDIKQAELFELSAVTVPSNPNANMVRGMKSFASDEDIKSFFEVMQQFDLEKALDDLFTDVQPDPGLDFHWIDEEKARELAEAAKAVAEEHGVEIHRTVVDGKEATVSVLDKNDKGISAPFKYFENGEGALSIDAKYLEGQEPDGAKLLSPDGIVSVREIESHLDMMLRQDDRDRWVYDMWPTNYPSGKILVKDWDNETTTMHEYIYTDKDNITIGEGTEVEIEVSIAQKAYLDSKAGAAISKKNREMIMEALEHFGMGSEILQNLLNVPDDGTAGQNDGENKQKGFIELLSDVMQG